MILKVLYLFICLCLHLSFPLCHVWKSNDRDGEQAKKKKMMKKGVSVWESKGAWVKAAKERARKSEEAGVHMKAAQFKPSLTFLAVISHQTALLSLSASHSNVAYGWYLTAAGRDRELKEGRRRHSAEVAAQNNWKVECMRDWWRKWGLKAKTIDRIH